MKSVFKVRKVFTHLNVLSVIFEISLQLFYMGLDYHDYHVGEA